MKGFKKMGLMFLAMVIALAGVGAAYAAWTDTLVITGTVNTGSVDIVVEGLSGTEVYKVPDHGTVVRYYMTDEQGVLIHETASVPDPGTLVAWGNISVTGDDELTFEFSNLLSSIDFMVDAKLHYTGSIPAIIEDITWDVTSGGDWINPQIADGNITAALFEWDPETHTFGDSVCEGYQIHECEWLVAVLCIHIPQRDALMGVSGSATITIELIQWNEASD